MPTLRTYNLFISHAWQYHDDYDRLVKMLDAADNFHYHNYSSPEKGPWLTLIHPWGTAG